MIKSFAHKGLEELHLTQKTAKIQPAHHKKIRLLLVVLQYAKKPEDIGGNFGLHPLKGDLAGYWSLKVSGNWRLIFRFGGEDIFDVDYIDYH